VSLPTPADDVTLDEAYWIAFGVAADSAHVDPGTGQLLEPKYRGPLTLAHASVDVQRLLRRHGWVAEPYLVTGESSPDAAESALLLALVRRGDIAPGAPPQRPPDGYVPRRGQDTVLDWVVLDRASLDRDRAYATLIAAAANGVLHHAVAPEYWDIEAQWRAGRIADVRSLSEERMRRLLALPQPADHAIP